MNVHQLPMEIIQKIFEFIDENERYGLLYVCKRWHSLIRNLSFETVTWTGNKRLERLKKQLSTLNKQDVQPLLGTRRLCINDELGENDDDYAPSSTELTKEEFLFVLSRFPNLLYLDTQFSKHNLHYMQLLCDYGESENMPLIEDIHVDPYRHSGLDQDSRILFFATHYSFRRCLKTMVCYTNSLNGGGKLLKSLLDFKTLRYLHIVNDSEPDLTLFLLLEGCPNLTRLTYHTTYPVPKNAADQLSSMLQKLKNQRSTMSQFLKNLESVDLWFPELEASYIDFFASHYPKSLNEVRVNLTETGRCFWNCKRKAGLILNLCKSLQKFNTVQLRFEKNSERFQDEEIDFFHQILNTITGKREFFEPTAAYTYGYNDNLNISMSSVALEYQCYVDFDYSEERCPPVPFDLKHLAEVDTFELENGYQEFNSFPTYYLKYAQMHCPLLTKFQIKGGMNRPRYNSDYGHGCCFLAECLYPENTTSLENMTMIMINGFDYSQELIDDLVEYFPKVEVLSITALESLKVDTMTFRLSKFKYLHTCIIDFHWNRESEEGTCFVGITDSKRSIQYSIDKWNSSNEIASDFESISADSMQERITKNDGANFAFYVESSNELTKIVVNKNESAYATLDLS
ncbi:unnamed protein product [Mucor hiemalis]